LKISGYAIRVAAALLFMVGLAYVFSQFIRDQKVAVPNDYLQVAASDIPREVILPDSSVITLNAKAQLVYNNNYSKTNRDVILEGEAFFQVSRNEKLSFRVFVNNSTVEVLGTSFNIKPEKDKLMVGVVTGHVAVYETAKKDNRVDLIQNEQVALNTKNNVFEAISPLNKNLLAWRTHKLSFPYVPLKNVFETVAEYFGKELVIEKNVDLSRKFEADFDNQSLDEVIKVIKDATPNEFNVEITSTKIIVSRQ
jgi:ferric-dicitrate binding protein FerR (iron transport regulator)